MNPKCFAPSYKLAIHKQFSEFLDGESVLPINIEISPCGFCNANCSFCFYKDSDDKEILSLDVLQEVCDDLNSDTKAITWTGGGEPTIHPQFEEILEIFDGVIEQGLFTNAIGDINYDPSFLDWIRVSKTDQDWSVNNLKTLVKKCKKVGICVNYDGTNNKEVEEALVVADEVSEIKYVQVRPLLMTDGITVDIEPPVMNHEKLFITDYKFIDAGAKRDYNRCYGYHFVPFIWHNGDVTTCGYQREGDYCLGNINIDSIDDIFAFLPEYVNVCSTCQIACKNHEINKIINQCLKVEDVNFV